MHSIITLFFATSLVNFAAAVPLAHGHKHHKPYNVHDAHHKTPTTPRVKVYNARSTSSPSNVDHENGTCGGSTGFVCAPDFCCSQWGYCGQTEDYCGSSNEPAPQSTVRPSSSQIPQSTPSQDPSPSQTTLAQAPPPPPQSTLSAAAHSYSKTQTTAAPSPPATATIATASATPTVSSSGLGDKYSMYNGDGSTSAGWPSTDAWVSFGTMWSANEADMLQSCTQFGVPNNSAQELSDLQSAIQSVGGAAGIDPRFILAIVLQESAACVRAPTTSYSVTNPGLMQSHDGSGSCNNGGSVQDPCPASEITQMIQDGVDGTSSGDGLKQCLSEATAPSGAEQYYQAARIYNSGSIAPGGNLDAGGATLCYASDIANRLTGWVNAPSTCNL